MNCMVAHTGRGLALGVGLRIWQVLVGQFSWLRSNRVTWSQRLRYTLSCCVDLPRDRGVNFFGASFRSDNNLGLLLLPTYLHEVEALRKEITRDGGPSTGLRVLDIGANVGQFAVAALNLLDTRVVSFEPNPGLGEYWSHNSSAYRDRWTVVRQAVSAEKSTRDLHFVRGKSAQGSFSVENARSNLLGAKEVETVTVESGPITELELAACGDRGTIFDLVKLDVEGHELDALSGIKQLKFKYIQVEVAPDRPNGFSEQQLVFHLEQLMMCKVT